MRRIITALAVLALTAALLVIALVVTAAPGRLRGRVAHLEREVRDLQRAVLILCLDATGNPGCKLGEPPHEWHR